MAILITGATGLIGTALIKKLIENGETIHFLTTQINKCITTESTKGFYWDIKSKEIDKKCFENVTTIIHLAGATIAKRWTKKYKNEIITSRVAGAQLIFEALKKQNHTITHFITASGTGIYPSDLYKNYSEEEAQQNPEFLGQVVQQWEQAADKFKQLKIYVTKVRFGLVLSSNGGVLPMLIKPIKMYAGVVLGNGNQWQSWIALPDLVNLLVFVNNKKLSGVYNAVSPEPITHKKLIKTLAKHLKKPILLPNIPKFVLKFILGEMHHLLFDSQNVSAKKIINEGFVFEYQSIEKVINELKKTKTNYNN